MSIDSGGCQGWKEIGEDLVQPLSLESPQDESIFLRWGGDKGDPPHIFVHLL